MGRCGDASRDGEYYFRSAFLTSEDAGDYGASTAVDLKSMGHTVADRGGYGKVL
jgi:hypothetical protein